MSDKRYMVISDYKHPHSRMYFDTDTNDIEKAQRALTLARSDPRIDWSLLVEVIDHDDRRLTA